MAGGGGEGRDLCRGDFPWRNLSWEKKFHEWEAGLLGFFLKNNEKIDKKKFFQLKVGNSIRTETNINYNAYEGFTSS